VAAKVQNNVLKMVLKVLLPGIVLDVGCGRGRYSNPLLNSSFTYVGIDISKGMLKIAKNNVENVDIENKQNLHLIQGCAEFLPFRAGIFDSVICIDMLHHLPDHFSFARVFFELSRATKLCGNLVVEIKNRSNFVYRFLQCFNSAPIVRLVTLAEVTSILRTLGFTHITSKGVMFPLTSLSPLIIVHASREPSIEFDK
jgi:SAM-dependent methyltransferase